MSAHMFNEVGIFKPFREVPSHLKDQICTCSFGDIKGWFQGNCNIKSRDFGKEVPEFSYCSECHKPSRSIAIYYCDVCEECFIPEAGRVPEDKEFAICPDCEV